MTLEHIDYDATALLALPKIAAGSTVERGLLSWSRPFLINSIRDKGVDVDVTRGITSLRDKEGVATNVQRPRYDDLGVDLDSKGEVALSEYGVLRNILANTALDTYVPMLNPTPVRSLIRNKYDTIEKILRPVGALDRQVQLFDSSIAATEAIAAINGGTLVAKPNTGSRSQGVVVGDRQTVESHLTTMDVPYLVEEKIDFTHAFPRELRGYDENEQRRLDEANRTGVNKELRMFYFGQNQWESVARVARPGETNFSDDKWLYIDDTTVPEEVRTISERVVQKLEDETGFNEMNIAVDFVYGTTDSNSEPHWQVMEVNGAEPQLVQLAQHLEIGRKQHSQLANQIARIALNRKT